MLLIPLFLHPDEYLAKNHPLFQQLTLRAISLAQGVKTLIPEAGPVIAVGNLPSGVAKRVEDLGATVVSGGNQSVAASLPFLPYGTRLALELTTPKSEPERITTIINPRNPALKLKDTVAALQDFNNSELRLLFSAIFPKDHPCQGKTLYTMPEPLRTMGDGATLQTNATGTRVIIVEQAVAAGTRLVLPIQKGFHFLDLDKTDPASPAIFSLPPDLNPPSPSSWGLAKPTTAPGPGRFFLPYQPQDAPWDWDRSTPAIFNDQGRRIMGRQDFPPIMQPEGSLCLVRAAFPSDSELTETPHEIYELPDERSLHITDSLSLLRWQLSTKHPLRESLADHQQ